MLIWLLFIYLLTLLFFLIKCTFNSICLFEYLFNYLFIYPFYKEFYFVELNLKGFCLSFSLLLFSSRQGHQQHSFLQEAHPQTPSYSTPLTSSGWPATRSHLLHCFVLQVALKKHWFLKDFFYWILRAEDWGEKKKKKKTNSKRIFTMLLLSFLWTGLEIICTTWRITKLLQTSCSC